MRQREHLWKKVANAMATEVASGRWPLGSIVPGEIRLAGDYGVSRDTVRRAMRELVRAGLFERTQHVGTRVISRGSSVGFLHEITSLKGIDEFGNRYERIVREASFVRLTREEGEVLGLPEGTQRWRLDNIRVEPAPSRRAVVVTQVYLDPEDAPVVEHCKLHPYELAVTMVERRRGAECTQVRQNITAVSAPPEVAQLLGIAAGAPALRIVRHYMDDAGKPLTSSISHHPGGAYSFSFSVKKKSMRSEF